MKGNKMSRPRFYWYDISKKMIMRYPDLDNNDIELMFKIAIESNIEDLKAKSNAEDRIKAVKMVLIDHTHTTSGAALILHYSDRNVQYWINEFVNSVGKEAGFGKCSTLHGSKE